MIQLLRHVPDAEFIPLERGSFGRKYVVVVLPKSLTGEADRLRCRVPLKDYNELKHEANVIWVGKNRRIFFLYRENVFFIADAGPSRQEVARLADGILDSAGHA